MVLLAHLEAMRQRDRMFYTTTTTTTNLEIEINTMVDLFSYIFVTVLLLK